MANDKPKNRKMNKVIRVLLALCAPVGLAAALMLACLFENFSEFQEDLWLCASMTLMNFGVVYISWCWGKGRNPYKFN